jgi:hypothetical protein
MSQSARRTPSKLAPAQTHQRNTAPASLWDKLDALDKARSSARWRAVPSDLAENVKHYLDGQPKR